MTERRSRSLPLLTPPLKEGDWLDWLRLLRSRRVGPVTFRRLIEAHGSAGAALDALPAIAAEAGDSDYVPCTRAAAQRELDVGQAAGAVPLALGGEDYPAALEDLNDPPPLLWAIGQRALLSRPAVALVGARNASSLGLRMARDLARDLSREGQVVVSGLARGVDAAAHREALDHGTIAVMGGGVDIPYPAETSEIFERIGDLGLRLSEQPMGMVPRARHFPRRNRLISGLARAVIVVEAAARSGSMITARDALDQGREVLAVPGHPLDARAAGCNILIREGAVLLRGTRDLHEALALPEPAPRRKRAASGALAARARDAAGAPENGGADRPAAPPSPAARAPARAPARRGPLTSTPAPARSPGPGPSGHADPPCEGAGDLAGPGERRSVRGDTPEMAARILCHLGPSPTQEDQLIRDLGVTAAALAPAILDLEIAGLVERQPGGQLVRLE
ncbi:DNA-processing protein DprA [Profundibacterium mesophilum]|uniref:DNA processing chain A n=1 Tax=Profundibacterium mesophilum KAUST100406-0324 TaxID=1037889 RepID=A0A921NW14_9RHOB|nr:DNA-processing protein DprA [Profundibacterium mesophilum]KAF0675804.1 DNA processing chain A [Profundibacterium mesophilum KAUST100406-0324]